MEERLINVQEVAYRVGCSIQTISGYYKFKNENPNNEYSLMLPDFVRQGNRNTRYWRESDVAAIIRFRNSIPQGRNGALGSVTQRYVNGTTKKPRTKGVKAASEIKSVGNMPRAYIDRVSVILQGSNVEPDVIEQVRELLISELEWRRELGIA